MDKEQTIEIMRFEAASHTHGHTLTSPNGDWLVLGDRPVNITKLYEATGMEALQEQCAAYEEAISVLHQVAYAGFAHVPPRVIEAINRALAAHGGEES